jgi:hypothetical protein
MSITADDPRLTAYALGEMTAEERRAFEDELADNAALLAEVKAISSLAKDMEAEMGREAPTDLGTVRRDMIAVQANAADRARAKKARSPVVWLAWSAAAAVAVAASVLLFFPPGRKGASMSSPATESDSDEQAAAPAARAKSEGRATTQRYGVAATADAQASAAPHGDSESAKDDSSPGSAAHLVAKPCDPRDPLCTPALDQGTLGSACASGSAVASNSACPRPSATTTSGATPPPRTVPAPGPPPRGIPPR